MDLINQTVIYKSLIEKAKEGKIVAQNEKIVVIQFNDGEKKLQFPNAFEKFLKCKDEKLQAEIEALIAERKEADARKIAEEREARFREAEETRKRAEETTGIVAKRTPTLPRKSSENNLAFKCNFCNGGSSKSCIGYKSVCSDEQIRYNIEVRQHSWCSNSNSPCRQYLDRIITRAELDAKNNGFVCYESRMLTAWTAFAGEDLDEKRGTTHGRRIQDAASNSLAVLTTRLPDDPEEKRIIFGAFITGQTIEGDEDSAGYVVARNGYTIELTPDEAQKMKFWHYYKNSDGGVRWSQGLYRYMKDTACARILADIVEIKTGDEKAHAQRVLEDYCRIKDIDINSIPVANGSI